MTFASLALPSLADVPGAYAIRSDESFARPLALSLLDTGVITDADVQGRPVSAIDVATVALSRRWNALTQGMNLFDWQLRIEHTPEGALYSNTLQQDHLWALIQTTRGPVSCRQVCIGGAMKALEAVREGLGQTVLATLCDAFRMLPTICTPQFALHFAEYIYWYGYDDEKEALEEAMRMHGCDTVDDLLSTTDFFTRSQFFAEIPEWVTRPQRVLTHRQVRRAAGRDAFAREVVDAMDAVWNVVRFYGPFADVRSEDVGADLIDFGLIVRWTEDDVTGRVIDDYLHDCSQGDCVVASSVTPLRIVGTDIADWLSRMEATALLAKMVERALALFMREEFDAPKNLLRVMA